ncbi:MAG TPA: aspartate dehydrogenase domain-containing protein [Clostridia bacterium]|nr:aspartate dehydrogenase domain-containing protein [Clostridia bacterium]
MAHYKSIGFLGCGKIGGTMLESLKNFEDVSVSFVQALDYSAEGRAFPVVTESDDVLLEKADLVVESATANVLKANFDSIIKHCDVMIFSVTAFSDDAFERHAIELAERYGRKIYLPHGAILGVDGIVDGSVLLTDVSIVTTKNPKSLGRDDTERTVVCECSTREACALYPRNVNVHATVALAGIGFDRTRSIVVSDPAVDTNTHIIDVKGDGIHFCLEISSFSTGGVTGKYTPYSACASLARVLGKGGLLRFV